MKNIPLLSIVIPTYNRVDSLYSLIDSIGHKNDPELEIVISDDHSDHEIFHKLKIHLSEYSNISLFRSAVRLGMVKNWNESINKARGEWICFDERIKYSPDAEFWYRIAFNYPVVKIKEPFAKYISHEHNYAFTTWMKADFLDQVGLICKINSTYFNGKDGVTLNNTIDAEEIGKDQTILTILKTTCMRTSKKQIFIKYYKIGLERSKNRRDALSFRILILNIFIKRIIAMCRVLARSWL